MPVRLSGPFEALDWKIQWSAVAAAAAKKQLEDKLRRQARPEGAAAGARVHAIVRTDAPRQVERQAEGPVQVSDLRGDASQSLHLYPIKSCAGVSPTRALLIETGLEFDRAWMVVDERRRFVTQRELPRLALVQPDAATARHGAARAGHAGAARGARRGRGSRRACASGTTRSPPTTWATWRRSGSATSWASRCAWRASTPSSSACRIAQWTGALEAENAFADGFPLLVASTRLAGRIEPPSRRAGRTRR